MRLEVACCVGSIWMMEKSNHKCVVWFFYCSPSVTAYFGQTTPLRPLGPLSTGSPMAARRAENRFSHPPLALHLLTHLQAAAISTHVLHMYRVTAESSTAISARADIL